nr:transposase [Streptomyces sp.]
MLAAHPAPVDRASSGLGSPFNARMWEPSTAAREKSRAFALRSLARRNSCSRGHTPASVHSARRRQQVMPEPKPSSCGRCSQEIPVCRTNRMPWNTSRSGCRLRPGCRTRRSTLGNSGSITAHNSSSTSHGFGRATPHPRINVPGVIQPPRRSFR